MIHAQQKALALRRGLFLLLIHAQATAGQRISSSTASVRTSLSSLGRAALDVGRVSLHTFADSLRNVPLQALASVRRRFSDRGAFRLQGPYIDIVAFGVILVISLSFRCWYRHFLGLLSFKCFHFTIRGKNPQLCKIHNFNRVILCKREISRLST